jgi:hypothetical protein
MSRVKATGSHCGGSNVFFDATAMWSIGKQGYIMMTTHDNTDCEDCDGECSVNWVPVEEEGAEA